jgi:LysM repeat protein
MKQNQISNLPILSQENLEKIFNVYQDQNGQYFYNLLQTVVFPSNLPESLFQTYSIKYGDTWPFISYKAYNTPNLWWLILLANDIHDATKIAKPGTTIRIPNSGVMREVLTQIERSI